MTNYIRPLFDIQRVYIDGKSFHYQIYYHTGPKYKRVVEACFFTMKGAEETIDELIQGEV